jgi:hypothetical protein
MRTRTSDPFAGGEAHGAKEGFGFQDDALYALDAKRCLYKNNAVLPAMPGVLRTKGHIS